MQGVVPGMIVWERWVPGERVGMEVHKKEKIPCRKKERDRC
jgi:hypothetical protein